MLGDVMNTGRKGCVCVCVCVCVCNTANAIIHLLLIHLVIIHHSKGSQHSGVFLLVYQSQHVSLPTMHSE